MASQDRKSPAAQVSPDQSRLACSEKMASSVQSRHSSRSARSERSTASTTPSMLAARARAEAAAARVQASLMKKEAAVKLEKAKHEEQEKNAAAEIERKKVELDTELHVLQLDREAAAAEAQAEILEAAVDQHGGEHHICRTVEEASEDRAQRTFDYVLDQAHVRIGPRQQSQRHDGGEHYVFQNVDEAAEDHAPCTPSAHNQGIAQNVARQQGDEANAPELTAMAKYLIRRDLVSTSLTKFDDCPENYRAWKSTFKGMTRTLEVTASEELDLLVKWLGAESSSYAKRLRSVHVDCPEAGLDVVWERLEECYGRPEIIEEAIFRRIASFPRLSDKDTEKLRELGDLLLEVEAAKCDPQLTGLSYLDTARGVNPIVEKLPQRLQDMWIAKGSKYKRDHRVAFPPFSFFASFIRDQAKTRNDPSFKLNTASGTPSRLPRADRWAANDGTRRTPISVQLTDVEASTDHPPSNAPKWHDTTKYCPLHRKPHPLRKCRTFREKPLDERKSLLKNYGICFRCCASTDHFARDCKTVLKCDDCGSERHATALHAGNVNHKSPAAHHDSEDVGRDQDSALEVSSKCTEVCGQSGGGKSCSKICLVKVSHPTQPHNTEKMYAILDDQSNRSLARTEFFDIFGLNGDSSPYTLRTCAGTAEAIGRRASGFLIEDIHGSVKLPLPTLIECNEMPNNRNEIPTPEVASHHPHLRAVAKFIPRLDPEAKILLLLGRDILRVHKVRQQRNGPADAPFAQRLDLGWVIVGNVCISRSRPPDSVSNLKTNVLENGRPSIFEPCQNHFLAKEKLADTQGSTNCFQPAQNAARKDRCSDGVAETLFHTTKDDNRPSLSVEDRKFLKLMDDEFSRDESNSWVAPLPFRCPRPWLPNNKCLAESRLTAVQRTLKRKPELREQFASFMEKMFKNGHAEEAPPVREGEECWYLPIFGVCHPRKPGETRVVFDSSAQFKGLSLNSVLLTGPDMINSLLGVLIRFRKEPVAITVDIKHMFYCFLVRDDHRNYLRFLWFRNNNIYSDVVEYRMKVHVFGNSPSPAVATYGLRRTAREGEEKFGSDVRQFIERDFYVDDGLKSLYNDEDAISLIRRTQQMLAASNLKLHKIASNCPTVLEAFPEEDRANDLKDLDLSNGSQPIQRSLGVSWNLKKDVFTFTTPFQEKPFTRRGVLSVVNSLYDPLGFVAPVIVQGKSLLRELVALTCDWDCPLPDEKRAAWEVWKDSLQVLEQLDIPRTYAPASLTTAQWKELHIFSDASTKAVAAVAYLRVTYPDGACHVGFVIGKAKLAPHPEHTIPRLELCGAVLAVELAELISREIDMELDAVNFYTDSKVVLGYIHNETRRFFVYVSNRVERIRSSTRPDQWHYVPSDMNPADLGTRSVPAAQMAGSTWLTGPDFLYRQEHCSQVLKGKFDLVDADSDTEVRPQANVLATSVDVKQLGSKRFERFSSWITLTRAVGTLVGLVDKIRGTSENVSNCPHNSSSHQVRPSAEHLARAKAAIILSVQKEAFSEEFKSLQRGKRLPKSSPLWRLDPWVDSDGLLRIGGRLGRANHFDQQEQKPIIMPGRHHVTTLVVRHYHEQVKHQGRHFTEGAVRAAGFWIVGAKRSIASYIHICVTCRKLRGRQLQQMMADLPAERLSTEPPFTYVGLDVFGPWQVTSRRTRGGEANSKRWAVLFTCMSIRAVHIEVIESMDTSSFIDALRRFFAIRGPAKQLRSDCGTNFVGACTELKVSTTGPDHEKLGTFLSDHGCTWVFNPPHASHMGGVWERMIGVTRRILDSMLLENTSRRLTHEVLVTLLAEVSGIINSRPLVPVSTDPECWEVLTPATLLTQKVGGNTVPPVFNDKDIYRRQWRQVQWLADVFWCRWRREFLTTLQSRRKWQTPTRSLKAGDLVLLRDSQVHRNEWPMGLIVNVIASADGKVRKVEIKTATRGVIKTFLRPVTETVLLIPCED
ncbi:uncharacterized protein LOC142563417 [Dermacentor variabilis]|uniref:uncharacterized protein LOC142563417 n=1 Tax=Dermacentor variabilis TaxID=34621 RepID=UPI003F5C10BB